MNPNEIRTGNYLYFNNKVIRASSKLKLSTFIYFLFGINKLKYCKPIPISKKWMEDFGYTCFKNTSESRFYELCASLDGILKKDILIIDAHDSISGNWAKLCEIKYIHELQNIVYSIKKTELIRG